MKLFAVFSKKQNTTPFSLEKQLNEISGSFQDDLPGYLVYPNDPILRKMLDFQVMTTG